MPDSPSFDRLLSRVRSGDVDGAGEIIVRRFAGRLIALAAGKISQRLRRRVEAEDVAQSVFQTLFRRMDEGLIELHDWASLWCLLARIAVWRICRHAERNAAARRSQDREAELTPDVQVFDREPEPGEVLMAKDLHDSLVADMPEKYRTIVVQILEGATHEEVAREQHTSISTVERVHRRVRERLTAMLAAET